MSLHDSFNQPVHDRTGGVVAYNKNYIGVSKASLVMPLHLLGGLGGVEKLADIVSVWNLLVRVCTF